MAPSLEQAFLIEEPGIIGGLQRLLEAPTRARLWIGSGPPPVNLIQHRDLERIWLGPLSELGELPPSDAAGAAAAAIGVPLAQAGSQLPRLIEKAAAEGPVVVLLDDPELLALQLGDSEVLKLLQRIRDRLAGRSGQLVLSCNPSGIGPSVSSAIRAGVDEVTQVIGPNEGSVVPPTWPMAPLGVALDRDLATNLHGQGHGPFPPPTLVVGPRPQPLAALLPSSQMLWLTEQEGDGTMHPADVPLLLPRAIKAYLREHATVAAGPAPLVVLADLHQLLLYHSPLVWASIVRTIAHRVQLSGGHCLLGAQAGALPQTALALLIKRMALCNLC